MTSKHTTGDMKRETLNINWSVVYKVVCEFMPEFELQISDPHVNDEYNWNIRRLNKYKAELIDQLAKEVTNKKKIKIGAGRLFAMKLDLQVFKSRMSGAKTMKEALNELKSLC